MTGARTGELVLDTGALIAFERNDRFVTKLVELAVTHDAMLHVPPGVLAQVWRGGARQARLSRLIRSASVEVHPLNLDEATVVGALCGVTGSADVVDANVAVLARRLEVGVLTSDPDDLRRLDPSLRLITC